MGLCWSEPPVAPVQTRTVYIEKPIASAPPQPYTQPQQYTYAVKPGQMYYQYQPPIYQQYEQQYQQQPYYRPQQQTQTSPATAFVGGLVLGAIAEDLLDPME